MVRARKALRFLVGVAFVVAGVVILPSSGAGASTTGTLGTSGHGPGTSFTVCDAAAWKGTAPHTRIRQNHYNSTAYWGHFTTKALLVTFVCASAAYHAWSGFSAGQPRPHTTLGACTGAKPVGSSCWVGTVTGVGFGLNSNPSTDNTGFGAAVVSTARYIDQFDNGSYVPTGCVTDKSDADVALVTNELVSCAAVWFTEGSHPTTSLTCRASVSYNFNGSSYQSGGTKCHVTAVTWYSSITALEAKAGTGVYGYGLSPPHFRWAGEATPLSQVPITGFSCTWALAKGSRGVDFGAVWRSIKTNTYVEIEIGETTGTGTWLYTNGTVTLGPSAGANRTGTWRVVTADHTFTTAHNPVKGFCTIVASGRAGVYTSHVETVYWSVTFKKPGGYIGHPTTSHVTATHLVTGTPTPTCNYTHPITTLATCNLDTPGSWFAALNPFTGGFDPIQVVACPVGWLFIPGSCQVVRLKTMWGVTIHRQATKVTVTTKKPATEWMGELVAVATEVPSAVKAGITGATTTCNITRATLTTAGVHATVVTFCGSLTAAQTPATGGGNLSLVKTLLTFLLTAGFLYAIYTLVMDVFRPSSGSGPEET